MTLPGSYVTCANKDSDHDSIIIRNENFNADLFEGKIELHIALQSLHLFQFISEVVQKDSSLFRIVTYGMRFRRWF